MEDLFLTDIIWEFEHFSVFYLLYTAVVAILKVIHMFPLVYSLIETISLKPHCMLSALDFACIWRIGLYTYYLNWSSMIMKRFPVPDYQTQGIYSIYFRMSPK